MTPTSISAAPSSRAASAALDALHSCASFLETVSDDAYCSTSPAAMGSTIGQHVRHALDHFTAAVAGHAGRVVDYDSRRRDTPVERSRTAALRAIAELSTALAQIRGESVQRIVVVRVVLSAAGDEAELGSTLGRELAFAAHHAVHHHAMMATIARDLGLPVPESFGRAPASIHLDHSAR